MSAADWKDRVLAGYFNCRRCNISWHSGPLNPAPVVCPNCGRPWDDTPLFLPDTDEEWPRR